MDVISDMSDISGIPAGESFNTEIQWNNGGDLGVLGSYQELAEMTARPDSSTPNKNPGLMVKKDTPRPCPKSTGNLSDSAESSSSEFIYVTSEEVTQNKKLQQSVSGFSCKNSKTATPDTLVRGKKRPASSPEDHTVSPSISPSGSGSSQKTQIKSKKHKSENKTPLKDTRRIWINRKNPTLLELVFIQKTLAIIIKVKEGSHDRTPLYYTTLENGQAFVKGPENNFIKIGKNIKIKPDPNGNEEVTLGLGRVQEEPRDDGPSGADYPSPNSSEGICESSTVHNSIDNSHKNTKSKTSKNYTTSELSGGIKTSNRFDAIADAHASAKDQSLDSDDFGDGDYRSDSDTHRDTPISGVGDHRRVRRRQLGKGGKFYRNASQVASSDSEPEGCNIPSKHYPQKELFLKSPRRKVDLKSTKGNGCAIKKSNPKPIDHFPTLPVRQDRKAQEDFYVPHPLPTLRNKQGNRISSSQPINPQASFTMVNNKKSAMAEDVTLSDPLKKVIKVTDNLSWDRDLLDNIRKDNPNLNIKNVTTWSNNFLELDLHEDNEVETVSVKGKDYFLFPYLIRPTKCGYCQRWGHPTKNCKSLKPPVCYKCSKSHPRRNTPCTFPVRCANCGGNHLTHDKTCRAYKKALQFLSSKNKNPLVLKINTKKIAPQTQPQPQPQTQPQTTSTVPSYAHPVPRKHVITKAANIKTPYNIWNKPVVLSDLVRILTGVFLSKGPEGEYENEPNGPQLTKATYTVCDVVSDALGITVSREMVLRDAYSRYKMNLPISMNGQIVTGDGPNQMDGENVVGNQSIN